MWQMVKIAYEIHHLADHRPSKSVRRTRSNHKGAQSYWRRGEEVAIPYIQAHGFEATTRTLYIGASNPYPDGRMSPPKQDA